jgi:hypothetical protein
VYVLAVAEHDLITVEEVLTASQYKQSANDVISIEVWLAKRNIDIRTDLE